MGGAGGISGGFCPERAGRYMETNGPGATAAVTQGGDITPGQGMSSQKHGKGEFQHGGGTMFDIRTVWVNFLIHCNLRVIQYHWFFFLQIPCQF